MSIVLFAYLVAAYQGNCCDESDIDFSYRYKKLISEISLNKISLLVISVC